MTAQLMGVPPDSIINIAHGSLKFLPQGVQLVDKRTGGAITDSTQIIGIVDKKRSAPQRQVFLPTDEPALPGAAGGVGQQEADKSPRTPEEEVDQLFTTLDRAARRTREVNVKDLYGLPGVTQGSLSTAFHEMGIQISKHPRVKVELAAEALYLIAHRDDFKDLGPLNKAAYKAAVEERIKQAFEEKRQNPQM